MKPPLVHFWEKSALRKQKEESISYYFQYIWCIWFKIWYRNVTDVISDMNTDMHKEREHAAIVPDFPEFWISQYTHQILFHEVDITHLEGTLVSEAESSQ